MKNPWKRLSKINPQREDGNRQINSKVLAALVKAKLPTSEMSIVLTIISKTWGFNKKFDTISVNHLSVATGFTTRAIQKSNIALKKKRIIVVSCSLRANSGSPLNLYMFNKHYDTWKFQDSLGVNSSSGGELSGSLGVNSSSPTPIIETSIIERDIYKYISPDILIFCKNFIEYIKSQKENLAPKSDNLLKNSIFTVDKLIRLDDFKLEYVREVLGWGVQDSFWSDNILSLAGLRRKIDGLTKFQKIANKYNKSKTSSKSNKNKEAAVSFIEKMRAKR